MAKTYKELKGSANKIKIEEVPLANTADRLGTHLEDIVDTVDEDITQIKKNYTLKSQMLVISETNPTAPPPLNGQFHYNKLENRMFVAASGNASPLTQIEGRSLLGTAPATWKIRYNQDSGKVSHFEQNEGGPLMRASAEQIVDDNELEVEYYGEIPEDRDGYKKTLFYGVKPNKTENRMFVAASGNPTLYATYELTGWVEIESVRNSQISTFGFYKSTKKESEMKGISHMMFVPPLSMREDSFVFRSITVFGDGRCGLYIRNLNIDKSNTNYQAPFNTISDGLEKGVLTTDREGWEDAKLYVEADLSVCAAFVEDSEDIAMYKFTGSELQFMQPIEKAEIEKKIKAVNEKAEGVDVKNKILQGYFDINEGVGVRKANGELFNAPGFSTIGYFTVDTNDALEIIAYESPSLAPVVLYDKNFDFIKSYSSGVNGITTITIPPNELENAVYYRCTISKTQGDKRLYSVKGGATVRSLDHKMITLLSQKNQDNNTKKEYGVKWDTTNKTSYGERILDAVGLEASIGIGVVKGFSDFDNIYPWSEMKRCNIKNNANGASIVIFEGEAGFRLDGSNGDVFVRIPKFFIQKYTKNNWDYRIISDCGSIPHPAFVENGKEVDEIFIAAFEAYKNSDNKLTSIADVIPTSNLSPKEFLDAAKMKGREYSLYDMRCVDALFTLISIEFANRNSNQIFGYGVADYWQPIMGSYSTPPTSYKSIYTSNSTNQITIPNFTNNIRSYMPIGTNILICRNEDQKDIIAFRKIISIDVDENNNTTYTFDGSPVAIDTTCFMGSCAQDTNWCETSLNPLLSHSGRSNFPHSILEPYKVNPMRYRWIENIVGNLWHFLPDVSFLNLQMYVCNDMSEYEMFKTTHPYTPIGDVLPEQNSNGHKGDVPDYNFWITNLMDDSFSKGNCFGKSWDKNMLSTEGFGAYYYLNSGNRVIANGGGFDHLYRCNILTNRAWITNTNSWYLYGARLIFKKII